MAEADHSMTDHDEPHDLDGDDAERERAEEYRDWVGEDAERGDGLPPIPDLPSGHYGDERVIPEPAAPLPVAEIVYADFQHDRWLWTLRRHRNTWMLWHATEWAELDDAQLRSHVYRILQNCTYEKKDKDGDVILAPWNPGRHKIVNVLDALAALAHLPSDLDPPTWIPTVHSAATGGDEAPQLISCTNGLLDLSTRELIAHTPAWFNLVSVPFAYDPDPGEPAEWLAFLDSVWGEDVESIALLQEYIGYLLSGHTHMEKMLLLVGPTRSGKGTIGRLLRKLLGHGHVIGPTLASLATNFGLAPLVGKPLAIVSDARLGKETSVVVERLLSITGEDTMSVDRKYRECWTGKMPTRFVILTNELPRFRDASGAIANRMLILQLTRSFLGCEDHELDAKLAAELPAILAWALRGLDRLLANDRFTVPGSSTDAVTLMMDLASPVSAFVRDRCVRYPGAEVSVDKLYVAWKSYAEDNGHRAGAKTTFGRDLRAVAPELKASQTTIDGKRVRCHAGIALNTDYSGKDPVHPVQEDETAVRTLFDEGGYPVQDSVQRDGSPDPARDDPVQEPRQNSSSDGAARDARAKTHSSAESERAEGAVVCWNCGDPIPDSAPLARAKGCCTKGRCIKASLTANTPDQSPPI